MTLITKEKAAQKIIEQWYYTALATPVMDEEPLKPNADDRAWVKSKIPEVVFWIDKIECPHCKNLIGCK